MGTYDFLCTVEAVCYDYTKSVLIDGNSLKFNGSIIVASLVSASIEVVFKNIPNVKFKKGENFQLVH